MAGTQIKMGPERLGDVADIVLVAINYRVGPLGNKIFQIQVSVLEILNVGPESCGTSHPTGIHICICLWVCLVNYAIAVFLKLGSGIKVAYFFVVNTFLKKRHECI